MLIIPLLPVLVLSTPPTYEITELGSLFGSHTHVFDMSEDGTIVGLSWANGLYSEPFVWADGDMIALPTFGGSISESGATDLLSDGTIVGYSATPMLHDPPFDTCEIIRAFLYQDDVMIDLGSLSETGDSLATGINPSGRIIGWSHSDVQSLTYHAFMWEGGVMSDLGTLGGTTSAAWDIDTLGRITGEARTSNGDIHVFLWDDGTMTDVDTMGSLQSVGRAMNDVGQITGMYRSSFNENPRSFLLEDGLMIDIGSLGGGYAEAFDINAHGAIVGTTTTDSGDITGFIWLDGVMFDLREYTPGLPDGFVGYAIDDAGRIAGTAWVGGTKLAYLLTPAMVGDLDDDGVVGIGDLLLLLGNWGRCAGECPADLDDDEIVGILDLLILLGHWSP